MPASPTSEPGKARDKFGWEPKIGFDELVTMMVDADLHLLAGGQAGEEFSEDAW